MPMIKTKKTQRNDRYIFQCSCGEHLIRIVKDEEYTNPQGVTFPPLHSLEFWEYRGYTNWNFWKRLKLAFRILIGKEAKHPIYEVLIENEDLDGFIEAFRELKQTDLEIFKNKQL